MIAKQRHHIILTLLETNDYLSIQEVATATASSEATARRDLLKLEADGQLERLHGGVTKVQSKHLSESSLQLKTQQAVDEKGRVAQYVAEHYLKAESVIFLDAGSATAALIPYLQAKNIT
ncbi:MAG: DeoR family transcriptional regulator, partial [Culicoidibacterales bacterium]